ncbi:MAG: leucine-rich repeat domain-containing protein, partial [Clostridia bacterium]|nr:leucine-rich repeat domain-containing protein [Clostridia bacterium]
NCPSLTRIIVSDDNMEYASQDGVLYNKEKTSILNVPKAITGSVEIPDSVTSIGDSVFYNCSSLTSIEIPDGVTSIGRYTFYNCSSLTSVYYTGTAEEWSAISIDSYNTPLTNATRYYYSETAPALNADGTAYDGNYWHYDESGEIVVWVYTKPEE